LIIREERTIFREPFYQVTLSDKEKKNEKHTKNIIVGSASNK
jgi:hypothetical protein